MVETLLAHTIYLGGHVWLCLEWSILLHILWKQRNTGNNISARLCYHSPTSNKKTWIYICNITRHTYPLKKNRNRERRRRMQHTRKPRSRKSLGFSGKRNPLMIFFFFSFLSEPFCELHFGMIIQWWMGSPKSQENYKRKKGKQKKMCGEAAMKSMYMCR